MNKSSKVSAYYVYEPLSLSKPVIPVMLENIDGGQTNLLRSEAVSSPLRIELGIWSAGGGDSVVHLFVDKKEIPEAEKYFGPDITEDQRFVLLPHEYIQTSKRYTINYMVNSKRDPVWSEYEEFEVDLIAPVLPDDNAPRFDETTITAKYLEEHNNEVKVTIPDYATIWPGDTIYYSLSRDADKINIIGSKHLTRHDIDSKPLSYNIKDTDFISLGDGQQFALYYIMDRAGNKCPVSRLTRLEVSATPKPRTLPCPFIPDASGSGSSQTLTPQYVGEQIILKIPEDASFRDDDMLSAQWGTPGTPGAEQTVPESGIRSFTIPRSWFPAKIGKTSEIFYQIMDEDSLIVAVSEILSLTVPRITPREFGAINCISPVIHGDSISLKEALDTGGVTFAVNRTWPFMAAGQRFTIKVLGLKNDGSSLVTFLLDNYIVTQGDVDAINVSTKLSYSILSLYKPYMPFTVETAISYDGGFSWLNFNKLAVVLVP